MNLLTSYCAYQNLVSDKISHLYDRTTPYPIDPVVFQGSKSHVGINLYTDNLKTLYILKNGSSNSATRNITTPF